MASCVIFCAGGFNGLAAPVSDQDYIIAADGGYDHVKALGLTPDCVLGDFDSLGYVPEGARVFPVEKDDTDTMLAVRHGLSRGYDRFLIYGALEGPRVDHTIANLQTLLFLTCHGARGTLIGNHQWVTTVTDGTLEFPETAQGTVSLFAMGAPAEGVTLTGLKYTLENGTLSADFPLGVSNSFTGKKASIRVKNGTLLLICDKKTQIL